MAMVAYGTFFLKCFFDTTFKTPNQVTSELQLPVLGTIPESNCLSSSESEKTHGFIFDDDDQHKHHVVENFRTLRVNIQYDGIESEKGGTVLAVTSTMPGEGKSINSANLAAAIAESGKKTLLINCDLRKPSMQKIFDYHTEKGIVNVLVGECTFAESVVHDVKIKGLDVLFCGPIPPNPIKLLLSQRFSNLLTEQRANYDYIILDAPPVFPISDVAVAAKNADGVLFVIRSGYIGDKAIRDALEQLNLNKCEVIGVIFNRFSGYGGHYGYGYEYEHSSIANHELK